MLILGANQNQWIDVFDNDGNPIGRITITQVRGRHVRLGFDFPKKFNFLRSSAKNQYVKDRTKETPRE